MRQWICALLAAALMLASASALELPQNTLGQQTLAAYIEQVNDSLIDLRSAPVNSVFMCFPTLAAVGVTMDDNAEVPEDVELTFQLYPTSLNTLQLRVSSPDLFGTLAAACIHAASPDQTSLEEARKIAQPYVDRVKKAPHNSFEDTVIEQNGTTVRIYFAYYPNQYHDEVNWLQMTLIFPLYGYEGAGVSTTPTPSMAVSDDEYQGIDVRDSYNHFEVFTTATPEPNSPAGESGSGL